jgi:hypothetical protein
MAQARALGNSARDASNVAERHTGFSAIYITRRKPLHCSSR